MPKKTAPKEVYISTDVEASGSTPARHSLLSIGACVVGDHEKNFYQEMRPRNPTLFPPNEKAMEINGLDIHKLWKEAPRPKIAVVRFVEWVQLVSEEGVEDAQRPVFVSFGTFDWMWIGYYLEAYGESYLKPFGPNTLDLKSFYMGWRGSNWAGTAKKQMPPRHLAPGKHTHNALQDAIEQSIMFESWLVEMLKQGKLGKRLYPLAQKLRYQQVVRNE